jgi:hypothetical protein
MPIVVDIDSSGCLVLTVENPYTFEDWIAALTPLLSRGPGLGLLVDRSRAMPPDRALVDRMVQFFLQHADKIKDWRAAVVTGSDVGYGVARMLEMTAEARKVPMHIQSFRTHEDARRWLQGESIE